MILTNPKYEAKYIQGHHNKTGGKKMIVEKNDKNNKKRKTVIMQGNKFQTLGQK